MKYIWNSLHSFVMRKCGYDSDILCKYIQLGSVVFCCKMTAFTSSTNIYSYLFNARELSWFSTTIVPNWILCIFNVLFSHIPEFVCIFNVLFFYLHKYKITQITSHIQVNDSNMRPEVSELKHSTHMYGDCIFAEKMLSFDKNIQI